MPMQLEILKVVRHVDETGEGTIDAVRNLWSDISLSREEQTDLVQEALAGHVNDVLRRSYRRTSLEKAEENDIVVGKEKNDIVVSVEVVAQPRETITMKVEILDRVSFDIHGQRRKVIDLTIEDTEYLMERSKSVIYGHLRQYQFAEYLHNRLEKTGAASVSGFGAKEKIRIAEMLESIEQREDLKNLPLPQLKGMLEVKA
jgi:hypothetical protein